MKKLIILIALAFAAALPLAHTGCSSAPNERVTQFQTLRIVGQTAKSSVDAAAQLLKQGAITVPQWEEIATLFDTKFQPTYALAVATARSDLSSPASPELIGLAAQLAALVAELTAK